MELSGGHPLVSHGTEESRLVRALRGDRPDTVPVWFMRQAGRSLPEYRALRSSGTMLEACLTPALASELTLQPVRRHGVDAAIFFSDIVVPLALMGLDVQIAPGRGPVFGEPAQSAAAIRRITARDPGQLATRADEVRDGVGRAVALLREESERRGEAIPLIGFAGAPFTLAAYLVEGGPSKDHMAARRLMWEDPVAWRELMTWTAEVTGSFLAVQIDSGASAGQLFDSWAGSLSRETYLEHSQWASRRALQAVATARLPHPHRVDVPIIHFGVGTAELLNDMIEIGVDAIGIDYRLPLSSAIARLRRPIPVQGNLDPALLFAPDEVLRPAVHRLLEQGRAAPAHIVNLGHGVDPATDPDVLTRVTRWVHEWVPEGRDRD